MKSSFKLLASLLFITIASNTSALGLGDITAESALNEPLVARIELLNADSLTNNDIIVAIGSQEDYRIAKVEREFSHTDFTFEARLDNEATPYISLTSSRAIVEPFVNFVVQVRWPQGKLLREYTILIDFPVFTGATQSQPVAVATTQPAARTQVTSTATGSPRESSNLDLRTSSNTQSRRTLTVGSGEYYVKTGDTLWGVASSVARSTGTTRNQAMLSIHDLNPEAFINGDVNALKSGVLLRVPNQQQMVQRSAADAASEFARIQQSGNRNNIEATPVQARDGNFRNQPVSATPTGGRLALASAAALGSSTGSNAAGAEGSEIAGALQDENIVLKEELDKVELENADLRDRLSALEERLEVTEALIEIENDELALAQQVAAEINAANADNLVIDDVLSLEAELEAEAEVEAVAQPQVLQPVTIQEKSILDTAIGFLPYIGAFVVVLLLVVFLLLKRRKAKEEDLLSDQGDSEYEVAHIDQDLSMDDSIEDEMQSTRSFTVDQDDDDIDGMDTLFSEDTDESDSFEEIQADAEIESQHMEDTLANFESTNVMGAQSGHDIDDSEIDDLESDSSLSDDIDDKYSPEEASEDNPIDELDEFADLDSFFNDDDIEDFDPTALGNADLEDYGESDQGSEAAETSEKDGEFNDSAEKMAFESFDLPSDSSSESIAKASLDHSNSMDFEVGIDLPELDDEPALEVDLNDSDLSGRTMDFDLDDIDPISEEDEIAPLGSTEDDSNSVDFDLAGIDLGIDEASSDEILAEEDESDSDQGLDFDSVDLNSSLDTELSDQDTDSLGLETLDLDDIDEELESDMDDLLSDMGDQPEITSTSGVESDESADTSDFDLNDDDDLLGDLSMASGLDSDLSEEIATKLELADAYADMGDARGAKELVEEILADGDETQKDAARLIAERIEGLV